jgi:DNA-directed RNA polymerase subunit RPC12/RpoP
MHVKFDCLHCDQPLRTRQTEKTRAVRCPACAGKVQIPRSRRPRPVAVLPVVEAAPSRLSSSWNSFKTPLMLGLAFACGAVAILATDSPDLTAGQSFQATPAVYGAASTSQGPTGRNRLTAPFFNVGTKGADAFQAQSVENGQADKPFKLNAGSSGKSDGCAAIDAAAAQTRFAEQRGEKSKSASSVSGGQIGGGRSGGGCSDVKSSGRKESNQSPAFNASVASI